MTLRFFNYMKDKYGLNLLQTEMSDIILEALEAQREIVKKAQEGLRADDAARAYERDHIKPKP